MLTARDVTVAKDGVVAPLSFSKLPHGKALLTLFSSIGVLSRTTLQSDHGSLVPAKPPPPPAVLATLCGWLLFVGSVFAAAYGPNGLQSGLQVLFYGALPLLFLRELERETRRYFRDKPLWQSSTSTSAQPLWLTEDDLQSVTHSPESLVEYYRCRLTLKAALKLLDAVSLFNFQNSRAEVLYNDLTYSSRDVEATALKRRLEEERMRLFKTTRRVGNLVSAELAGLLPSTVSPRVSPSAIVEADPEPELLPLVDRIVDTIEAELAGLSEVRSLSQGESGHGADS